MGATGLDSRQLMEYMSENGGIAKIGKAETLETAKKLESEGLIENYGELGGNPVFRLTAKGILSLKGKGQHSLLKSALDKIQDYAQAFKESNSVGGKDITSGMKMGLGNEDEFNVAKVYAKDDKGES